MLNNKQELRVEFASPPDVRRDLVVAAANLVAAVIDIPGAEAEAAMKRQEGITD